MQQPTMNATTIVFAFGGDLWSVSRNGGAAVRLTSSPGAESSPSFSPDGKMVAFTGSYAGNADVYVVPAEGGVPKRLTFQPNEDFVSGWTPDGKSVLFTSSLLSGTDLPRLFTVGLDAGLPKPLPLPSGSRGCFAPDAQSIAYDPGIKWQNAWKRYRGGQTSKIWVARLSDSSVTELPRKNSNDTHPMWVGDKIYFLSDRNGPTTLFCYDRGTKKTTELVKNSGFEMKNASAGPGGIVLEQLGSIKLYDTAKNKLDDVPITIAGDFPEVREQFKKANPFISSASISPTGARTVFEARGEIVTVPASKGDIKNLTESPGVADRAPTWSPDGQSIAYLTDKGGEYRLAVMPAKGGEATLYDLGDAPAYYYSPQWSPDSKKVVYTDNRHSIWIFDLASKKNTKVDTTPYENPTFQMNPVWSPDSKWLTYHRDLDSHVTGVFLYSLDSGKVTQVTDVLSDAFSPCFDRSGKYLYFGASTNSGTANAWLDLSSYRSINRTAGIYCAVLRKDLPSPLAPESDDEPSLKPAEKPKEEPFRIDLDGLDQRIIALPMPALNYAGLKAGAAGSLFAVSVSALAGLTDPARTTLWKFDLATKAPAPFASDVMAMDATPDGQKLLLLVRGMWMVVPSAGPPAPGQGVLDLSSMDVKVDPRAEWRQMYHEVWRIERDFLYTPTFHGQDLRALERRYEPFLEGIVSRADLNYLFEDMLGEISIGHMFIRGGDIPGGPEGVPNGLLGADYTLEGGRYRLARVYNGENWNPGLRAPLTQPGVDVHAGDFILAIDGKDLKSSDNIYEALENKAGKQVRLKVASNAEGTGSREVTVVPTASEAGLRLIAWREDNRRMVDKLSNGKLGYMHIPDTNVGGWTNFNRYYYAQLDKQGMVVDERFNHGGQVDDFMTEMMIRPLRSMWTSRYGKDFSSPFDMIYGPKALLTNAFSGSGGDYFPWVFRKSGAGPLIGERTWGGLVGILNFPALIDGGSVTAPNIAFYNPNGTWDVENWGVAPDIEVPMDPALWRQGRDPQIERAVAEVLKALQTWKKPEIKKPAYPDKSKTPPPG
jgi:tricorn protease